MAKSGDPKPPKAPKSVAPLAGCRRCRGTGAIEVQLCRAGRSPELLALRCTCPASAAYGGLVEIGRFTDGWQSLGATVNEWPTLSERSG